MNENKVAPKKELERYIQNCKFMRQLSPATMANYQSQLRVFFELMPEVRTYSDITVENISLFFKRLQTRKRTVGKGDVVTGVKKSTIESYWNKLNPLFEWFVARELMTNNPLRQMKKPKPEYTDRRKLERYEVEKIIAAILTNTKSLLTKKRDEAIFYLLLFCGLRKSELVGLQVRDINLDKRILTVRGETSKSKRSRQIPINHTLAMHLADYLEERRRSGKTTPSLIVSITRDRGLTRDGLKHWVKRIGRLSGVKFHAHQFRHTFACMLAATNAGAPKIQRLMGHTDLRMTQRYLRSMGVEDLRSEINMLSIDGLE